MKNSIAKSSALNSDYPACHALRPVGLGLVYASSLTPTIPISSRS